MIITPETFKALCLSTLTPLNKYDTVQSQNARQSIINGLMRVTCEVHDHGDAFILETEDNFRIRTCSSTAELPKTPKQPDKSLGGVNYNTFIWELKLCNTYMETEHATIALLKEVFLNSLVGLKITYR